MRAQRRRRGTLELRQGAHHPEPARKVVEVDVARRVEARDVRPPDDLEDGIFERPQLDHARRPDRSVSRTKESPSASFSSSARPSAPTNSIAYGPSNPAVAMAGIRTR